MNGNYLLDTNIVIALLDNDYNVIQSIENSEIIYLPSIVIGEWYYGASNSKKIKENISQINDLIQDSNILDCDELKGNFYGQIKKELKKKGNPIPENDIWIAAVALQYNLNLVSRDKHFKNIDKLQTFVW